LGGRGRNDETERENQQRDHEKQTFHAIFSNQE
jgi:hypothetical protein